MIFVINEFIAMYPVASFVLLGIICLLIGSFLNVVIYRLPLIINADLKALSLDILNLSPGVGDKKINLCFPRSHCQFCKKQISAWHNIPIFSYIFLKGKCQYCEHGISLIYPLVELLTMVLSLVVGFYFGLNSTLIYILPFVWILVCLSFIDLKHQILPDCLTLSLLWLGLLANTNGLFTSLPSAIYGAIGAYLGLWLFIKLFYLITGKIGMGNGDFKLFAALGAWFGWNSLIFILLISSILGTILGMIYLNVYKKSKDTPIPFGPFLCFAGFSYLFLEKFIVWP
jgi:leader peptidase (prepilin peptidase) / N-methyltransferase